jgi:uncharacterized protein YPO0396
MTEALFSPVELGHGTRVGHRLSHLEVFNWGTFDQHVWRFTLGGDTSLLTGDIGSGKSTLVDALTTLLMPAHKIAYNKAAGADARERTLRTYVEGHYKSERLESSGASRPIGLRSDTGKHYSVLLGVFRNEGHDETVTLAQVFQQRDSAGQPYRFYVTSTRELSIAADFADFGSDLRDLRRRLRATGAEVFDEFPKYSVSLRRLLGIRSEQALELFHQTVSMKSVGNLNDFVRDHMLEPSDAADRVRGIIAHFEDLTKAHDTVKRAREQLEALEPIRATAIRYDAALATRAGVERDRAALAPFIAELRRGLLDSEIAQLDAESGRLLAEQSEALVAKGRLAGDRDALIEERARAGGDRLGELEREAKEARDQAAARRERRTTFRSAVDAAGLEPVTDAAGFAALQQRVPATRQNLAAVKRRHDEEFADAIAHVKDLQRQHTGIADELASLAGRTTNLPPEQIDLRLQLCRDLGLTPDALPYAGELIDVREEHTAWRGAAERVLRGFALSLLVPQAHYAAVTGWVNGRRLVSTTHDGRTVGVRLVYERVAARRVPLQRDRQEGLVLADCLEIKDGEFREYLLDEVSRRADHRCADTLAEFRAERRAVTREGQIRSGERHEKDDRHRVDDPRRWVLGWVNERKTEALQAELGELERSVAAAERTRDGVDAARQSVQRQLDAMIRFEGFAAWADLDVAESEARANAADAERERLQAGSSRLEEVSRALAEVDSQLRTVEAHLSDLTGRLARLGGDRSRSRAELERDHAILQQLGEGRLTEARASFHALTKRLGKEVPTASGQCQAARDRLSDELSRQADRLGKELGGYSTSLITEMGKVLARWPELKADLDASVDARADFLAFHERVANDDLPRFEGEFKQQLNTNTIRELAQFNNWLRRQASEIDDRVTRINESLGAISYNPGRYIKPEKQQTTNQDVARFRTDLRAATDDTLSDDDHYSEQRFLDVKGIIERLRGREGYADIDKVWARRVTDVRNWFVFSASERDKQTDVEWEHYSDSDGKSGGQKEKLAYTILAASLAYQFGLAWGVTKSRDFRFAVIDEAFGRGSDVSTRYALDLFERLGLQLLIVTPLQKVHIIEPYVKAIGYVDNPDGTRSRLHTMTIEEYREKRVGQQ